MQELMQTVLNKTKVILLLLACCGFNLFAQQIDDIELKLSVGSTVMSPSQQGTLVFTLYNHGNNDVNSVWVSRQETIRPDGTIGMEEINFDAPIGEHCNFDPVLIPIDNSRIFFKFDAVKAGSFVICQLNFEIPANTMANTIDIQFNAEGTGLNEINLNNNAASVRINIKKSVSSVPVLNIWGGFALLLALMVAARQRYKKGI